MNKRKKDESQATYITEGISFGTFLGVVLSLVLFGGLGLFFLVSVCYWG